MSFIEASRPKCSLALGRPRAPSKMPTYFAIWCPRGDECTKKGKMLCKFADEQKTRSFLFNHLVSSPYHGLTEDDARAYAENADIEQWNEEDAEEPEVKDEMLEQDEVVDEDDDGEPWGKRFKGSSKGKGKGKDKNYKGKGKGKGIKGMTKDDISSAVASGLEQGLARIAQAQGAASSAIMPAQTPASAMISDSITISKTTLLRICDHLQRAEDTCMQSARVAQAAVNVFEREGQNLNAARQALQGILR